MAVENNDVSVTECVDDDSPRSTSEVLLNIRDLFETKYRTSSATAAAAATTAAAADCASISSVERLLASISDLLETRIRTDSQRRHEADENQQMMNEWMIAAAVIDRVCLIVFSFIFVIGTATLFILGVIQ